MGNLEQKGIAAEGHRCEVLECASGKLMPELLLDVCSNGIFYMSSFNIINTDASMFLLVLFLK